MPSRTDPPVRVARNELELWGRWWRGQELRECNTQGGEASPAFGLMEVMVLGCRVQKTNTRAHRVLSSAIRTPDHIQMVGNLVDDLPLHQRQAVVVRYLRGQKVRPQPRALLLAEVAIGKELCGAHVEGWAHAAGV